MNRDVVINILRFLFLAALQVLILNRIQLGGYLNPFLYVLFILLLPVSTPGWLLLGSAFLMGLSVDVFSETGGIHAAASVLIAFIRPGVLNILTSRQDMETGIEPTISAMGLGWFARYSLTLILIHHLAFFLIEAGSLHNILPLVYRIILSSVFTFVLVIISQYLFYSRKR